MGNEITGVKIIMRYKNVKIHNNRMENKMGFNDTRKEYVIEDMFPKRPLINYLWNERYITAINQFGG